LIFEDFGDLQVSLYLGITDARKRELLASSSSLRPTYSSRYFIIKVELGKAGLKI